MTAALLAALLPIQELGIVDKVAGERRLSLEEKALLVAIRRAENGAPHIAFGVANPRCRTYVKQCRWAANTIRLRYDGNLHKFAMRWCPDNWRVWLKNVKWFMNKQGVSK